MEDETKLYVVVNYTNKQSYIAFEELETFGEFKKNIKKHYGINKNFKIYSESGRITMNYDDTVTMEDIISSKALYNQDELTIRVAPTESILKWFKNLLIFKVFF